MAPAGWVKLPMREVLRRRENPVIPAKSPDTRVLVMTLSQAGEIRPREAGKGRNPPEWIGSYFREGSVWYIARSGDIVFSRIDLWKGCIAVVPPAFNNALATKEFPIYRVVDERIDPEFLSCLLRSRYFQRAFRAITTGHSNRRRTQVSDFEALEIFFPPDIGEQRRLVAAIGQTRGRRREAERSLRESLTAFDDVIDGRGSEDLPSVEMDFGVDVDSGGF